MTLLNRFAAVLVTLTAVTLCSCSQSTAGAQTATADINANMQKLAAAINAKDVNSIMSFYSADDSLLVFDAIPPRQYVGAASFRKDWEGFLSAFPTSIHAEVTDWKAEADTNLGYGHGIFHVVGPGPDGKPLDLTVRVTEVFRNANGKWLAIHEHVSFPVDLETGKPDLSSKP